jgi:histidinol phosphatase-like enzyme
MGAKMKILFLDIDGVLNSGNYIKRLDGRFDDPKYQIDPEAVVRLNAITQLTGCKIVVSSTWRLAFLGQMADPLRSLQGCLQMYGITGEVIDMTPNKPNSTRNRRGKEIQAWLDEHYSEVEVFVIVDDDSDMGRLCKNQVKTLFAEGLQDPHVRLIVSILGMKDDFQENKGSP